jgi:hypothetical protein
MIGIKLSRGIERSFATTRVRRSPQNGHRNGSEEEDRPDLMDEVWKFRAEERTGANPVQPESS